MKKRVQPTEINIEDAEYKFCMNSLRSLMKDPSFAKNRKVLEDIAKVFDKVYENGKKSKNKNQRLESEIASNVSKIKAALQLSEEDKSTIDTLKEELEKAWKMADEMRSKASESAVKRQSSFPELGSVRSVRSQQLMSSKIDVVERPSQQQLERQAKTIEGLVGEKMKLEMGLKDANSLLKDRDDSIRQLELKVKVLEEQQTDSSVSGGDRYSMMVEIENNRLRVFELEEEMANKDKCIEDLMKENEDKMKSLEEKDTEMCFLKARLCSPQDEKRKDTDSIAIMTDPVDVFQKDVKSLEAQVRSMNLREKRARIRMRDLEEKLNAKVKLLTEAKAISKSLRLELREKSETCRDLMDECSELRQQLKKITSTVRELEWVRDKNVCAVGQLEMENIELRREIAEFKHCKYPEEIEHLNEKFENFRKRMEKEQENWLKCKKSWELATVEKNEMKIFVSKIRNEIKVALQLIDSFKDQNGVSTLCKSESRIFSKPIADHESSGDLLSLFHNLVNYLVELCKDLSTENQKLNAENKNLRLLQPVGVNELGFPEMSQIYSGNALKLSEQEKEVPEKTPLVELDKMNIAQNNEVIDSPDGKPFINEIESSDLKEQLLTDEDLLEKEGGQNQTISKEHEIGNVLKISGFKKNMVNRQQPRRKSELPSSPEWKRFKDQVKLKTRKLNAMEANIEAVNSKFSGNSQINAAGRLRTKERARLSVQPSTLENCKRSFKK